MYAVTRWQAKFGAQARGSNPSEGNGCMLAAGEKAWRADGLDESMDDEMEMARISQCSPTDGD